MWQWREHLPQVEQFSGVSWTCSFRVTASCLGCHARHGYAEGDIRGGLSITIPIDWAQRSGTAAAIGRRRRGCLGSAGRICGRR